ncbi:hypothetical protein GM415_17775 [Pseudodesulfovibrio cashew]|uniref:Ethanolamine utilization protein n=1 Tax=Pseudodesulfovibrio cashew TaxID=2678688 RepID=A0A6I6JNT1_9BACT|nr:hypothetical protein [Pseudodesulfovibrio cashew]QGY41892.1 hypothetical protein GM415_17775 [Pseudodesulfovibrio cashew]
MTNFDLQDLARRIAREVLNRLQEGEPAPCVLVLAERSCELAEKVRASMGDGYDYFFLGEETPECDPHRYVLPGLSCVAMAQLAVGGASEEVAARVLGLLLRGKRVEVLEYEHRAFDGTAPHALYSLYESHVETLTGYGLVPLEKVKPERVCCREMLVTEDVVERHDGVSVLMVPKTALVTPLAYDAARDREMTIRKCL